MLSKPILHSRIGKWALAFTEYSLTYFPLKAVKGQIVADFIIDHSVVQTMEAYAGTKPWRIYFDGSIHKDGSGVGIFILCRKTYRPSLGIRKGSCSSNEVKYETLITRLYILWDLGETNVEIKGDLELVVRQLKKEDKCIK